MQEMQRNWLFVSAKGGQIDFVSVMDDNEGEVMASVAVPAGRVPVNEYFDLCPDGCVMQLSKGLAALPPKGGVAIHPHPEMYQSGANPDFQPSSADAMQRQLRAAMFSIAQANKRVDAKIAKLMEIERIPNAPSEKPADEGGEVVEP